MELSDQQKARWQEIHLAFSQDAKAVKEAIDLSTHRKKVALEIAAFLRMFVGKEVAIEELRATLDSKTRSDWVGFAMKGMSSGMFLNQMVKYIPDQARLTSELRAVVPVPRDEPDARRRMAAFAAFLEEQIESGRVARRLVAPARIPFLISGFWHVQEPASWPIYYESARKILQRQGVYTPADSPVDAYFAFVDAYETVSQAVGGDPWTVERLCVFERERTRVEPPPVKPEPPPKEPEPAPASPDSASADVSAHTHAQWMLASLGKAFGMKIWIAPNDHNKVYQDKRLGDLSIPNLPPLGIGNEIAERIVRLIDVLWIKGANQVVAAFEIEHSTAIYSGLLRMADLTVLSPNISFPLYIVAPADRIAKVRQQLSRPSLQTLELHERCGFFSIEALAQNLDHIRRWAKDAAAIDELAEYVEAVEPEFAE
jgi:hypothetical protein